MACLLGEGARSQLRHGQAAAETAPNALLVMSNYFHRGLFSLLSATAAESSWH